MAIDQATRILIVLQAGTDSHEGRARALHSVLYATELREAGATVRLVFDGAGTGWLARWTTDAGAHLPPAGCSLTSVLAASATRCATTAPGPSMCATTSSRRVRSWPGRTWIIRAW